MKLFPAVFAAFLLIAPATPAQQPDLNDLNQKIAVLYSQGKFDDAIPLAEKVVSAEKKTAKTSTGVAVALANLAQLQKEKAKMLRANISKFPADRRLGAQQESGRSAEAAKKLFREAIEVHRAVGSEESGTAASLKKELAWLTFRFYKSDSIRESRANIDEAETLYTEAMQTAEKLPRDQTGVYLTILKDFGDFYMNYVNFEKAFPLYEKHVLAAEKAFGPTAKDLIAGLRGLHEIYSTTLQEDEAAKVRARLTAITGSAEKPVSDHRDLTGRTRGIAAVKADGFYETDLTDLDRSFTATAELRRKIQQPGQYSVRFINVEVVVDEEGRVVEAKAVTDSKYTAKVEEAAMASKFRPFELAGVRRKMKGKIVFRYRE